MWKFYLETNLKRTRTSVSTGETALFFPPLPHKQDEHYIGDTIFTTHTCENTQGQSFTTKKFFKEPFKKQIIASTLSYEYGNKQSTYVNKLLAYHKER